MVLDANGNLGLGTTAPSSRIMLSGTGVANGLNFNQLMTMHAVNAGDIGFTFRLKQVLESLSTKTLAPGDLAPTFAWFRSRAVADAKGCFL